MAVVEIKNLSSLRLRLELPMVDGKSKTKTNSFSYLKHDALAQDAYDVGDAIASLQEHSVLEIIKQDNTTLGV